MTRKLLLLKAALLTLMLLQVPASQELRAQTADYDTTTVDARRVRYFRQFRKLFDSGTEEEFYGFANYYNAFLKEHGVEGEYYKIKTNEGYFDLNRHHLLHALNVARELEHDLREDQATAYYYLATGLMGDIYKASHNSAKAEKYYQQALVEVEGRDPKFTMVIYMRLAELKCLTNQSEALTWVDGALLQAEGQQDAEYESMALAMKGYLLFLMGDAEHFYRVYEQYEGLKSRQLPRFCMTYDRVMQVAKTAFDGGTAKAAEMAQSEPLNVDRSLVLFRVYALAGDSKKGFEAITRRFAEMDSIYGAAQDASLDDMAGEMELNKTRQAAEQKDRYAKRLRWWMIGLSAAFLFIYIMGRRRLMRKIWQRNRELTEAREKIEKQDRTKSDFIRTMSHEIRTPLNAINGFAQLLCMPDYELTDEEKRDMKHRITSNVDIVTVIINELLEMAEGESIQLEEQRRDVSPNEVCRAALKAADEHNDKGLEMKFSSDLADDFTFPSNYETISHILSKLLDNAVKFTPKGSVALSCEVKGDKLQISVSDTGIGVAQAEQARIFENFVKLNEYSTGIGLGLPISRRLADTIGGTLEIDPAYSGGSRFVLQLPLKQA